VTLQERAQIAEKIKADVFISIHMNSSPDRRARGFETYYLDNHNDVAVKKIEKLENINTGLAEGVQQILLDLVVEKTVSTSKPLGQSIHSKLKNLKTKNRGIKPALFYVLALSKRPGVLLEAGFMTNSEELKLLRSEKFMKQYCSLVARGISDYYRLKKN
jgi:N-acetylmuramoyl-L-alanine amidase